MKRIKENVNENELLQINEKLVKFNDFIQDITRNPTDEHITMYEHWIACMYDIQNIITRTE